ncbi:hypothetical protein AcW2_000030 [Taiwanofungus camphoratus]|nr:hypothetical protein AcW2_000030 [Antrodia cinnamomea]
MRDAGRGTRDSGRCHRSGSTQGTGGKHGCGATARLPRDGRRHAPVTRGKSKQDYHIIHTGVQDHHAPAHADREPRPQRRSAVLAHTPDPPSLVPRPCKLASLKPEAWRPLRDVLTPAPHPLLRGRRAIQRIDTPSDPSSIRTHGAPVSRLPSRCRTRNGDLRTRTDGWVGGWVGPRSAPAGDR